MPKLLKHLSEAYPLEIAFGTHLRLAFFFGAFVFAFLFVFKPFGLSEAPGEDLLYYAAIYGCITFFVMLLNYAIMRVFPGYFKEKNWFVWKQVFWVLWNILSISLINYLFTAYYFGAALSLKSLLWALGITFSVGIFPVSIMISLSQVRFLKANMKEAQGADDQLKDSKEHFDRDDNRICLSS